MTSPVTITGVGVVTALGTDSVLLARRATIRADHVRGDVHDGPHPPALDEAPRSRLMSASTARLLAAAEAALRTAGDDARTLAGDRLGLAVAIGPELELDGIIPAVRASMDADGRWDPARFATDGHREILPLWFVREHPVGGAGLLAMRAGAAGPSRVVAAEDAGGLQAVGDGLSAIDGGEADAMLCGGTATECAPFKAWYAAAAADHARRPGFGAAALLLEAPALTGRRSARPWAEVLGYASVCDEEPGSALREAILAALADASCRPGDIDAVVGGESAAADVALARVFARSARPAHRLGLGASLGDLGAAAGALHTAVAATWLRQARRRWRRAGRRPIALVHAGCGEVAAGLVLGASSEAP